MIASYDAIEPEKSDFVSAGFNTDKTKLFRSCGVYGSLSRPRGLGLVLVAIVVIVC